MTNAFITGLLLVLTVNAEDNSAVEVYNSCKNNLPYPKKGTGLPNWCRTMRIDVGSCLSEKVSNQFHLFPTLGGVFNLEDRSLHD
ncbi:unnamed protein product [Haemonchus placei]|uniref:Laminin N-terminal domain-containing protein n=1 Tax=Haemonchus placei TaxID=6290 RepID=A0A0N4WJM3_HAEPC|nr:unnamed protein product [Haemonchus placei]